jgi:hypothetical protein
MRKALRRTSMELGRLISKYSPEVLMMLQISPTQCHDFTCLIESLCALGEPRHCPRRAIDDYRTWEG